MKGHAHGMPVYESVLMKDQTQRIRKNLCIKEIIIEPTTGTEEREKQKQKQNDKSLLSVATTRTWHL